MKLKLRITAFFAFIIFLQAVTACKTSEEPEAVARFAFMRDTLAEGDTLFLSNQSEHARSYMWSIPAMNYSSSEESPFIVLENAGKFDLTLVCKNGDGRTNSATRTFEVLPDTIYRLSRNSVKKWNVKSITMSGSEMLTEPCQKDDEFTVYHDDADTCTLTEGVDKCPSGTYLLDLPASSPWRFNSKKGAFEFALMAFGSTINVSVEISELTHTVFKGTDKVNKISIWLETGP